MSNTIQMLTLHVTVEQALDLLCSVSHVPLSEPVPIEEASGRVLAEEFRSPFPMPPYRRAAMDGYAVRAASIASATPERPARLSVVREIKAGDDAGNDGNIGAGAGNALRVFTGAPVPDEYDTVVMQETVVLESGDDANGTIRVDRASPEGKHVAEAGEDIPKGKTVLTRGTPLGAKEIGLLAAFGCTEVQAYAKPKAVVLPIGDELIGPDQPPTPYRIYDANGFMLEARLKELGASVTRREPLPDDPEAIAHGLEQALRKADIVVTTGGISVGKYDHAARALNRIGASPLFTKVAMRPGTPTSAYAYREKRVICLSGNPSACFAGMELLLKPFVVSRTGRTDYMNEWTVGQLLDPVAKPSPYPRYIRCRAEIFGDNCLVAPLGNDKSGNMAAFADANALALIPAGGRGAERGERVRVLRLNR
ncbi:gephyrin-like molybdotransferase Glp [Cohnella massiliensis]|uniref:molybdopterin molybdotransferase MoeA n=1 Tax=Cohnella massiliensis TaxID=1816691 RepID=UPI0009BAB850|nr:gephyrin-like molybdotransferase Glp [Cohnella massiliensis]